MRYDIRLARVTFCKNVGPSDKCIPIVLLQGLLDKTEPEQIQRGIMMKASSSNSVVNLSSTFSHVIGILTSFACAG